MNWKMPSSGWRMCGPLRSPDHPANQQYPLAADMAGIPDVSVDRL
ncbi:hypothetical protein [Paenibacillus sp. 1011MAR3C5]|nr:hypothetical protein [Paenibacillus sp. 1011MAR3C5]